MKGLNLPRFLLLVFAISWLGVLPSQLIARGIPIPEYLKYLDFLMTLGPILGVIIVLYSAEGTVGLRTFFKRLLYYKASPLALFISLLSPILIFWMAAVAGGRLSGLPWPEDLRVARILSLGMIGFAMYFIINTEELAWRGVVFDHLLQKYSFVQSCLLLIPIWWLFHIPLFLYPGGHPAGYGLGAFTCIVVAQTFTLGWIYVQTNRSLLYPHLHHQLLNGFGEALPIFPVMIGGNLLPLHISCGLLLFLAFLLILKSRAKDKENAAPTSPNA